MRLWQSYHPYAAISVSLWALSYVFTRVALRSFSPFSLGCLRYLVSSAFLAVVLLLTRTGPPPKKALRLLIACGATGFFLYMIALNTGSRTVPAAISCTIVATAPLLTMLLARVLYRERLRPLQYAAACLSFFGVVVLTLWNLRLSAGTGLLYIFAAAVLLSVYNLLSHRLTTICPPLQGAAFSIFCGTLMLGIFLPQSLQELPHAAPEAVGSTVFLGVFCGAIAYCCWSKALSLARDTACVSNYMFVQPFLTAAFGWLIAGEPLEPSTAVGGLLILAGMFLFYFGERLFARQS